MLQKHVCIVFLRAKSFDIFKTIKMRQSHAFKRDFYGGTTWLRLSTWPPPTASERLDSWQRKQICQKRDAAGSHHHARFLQITPSGCGTYACVGQPGGFCLFARLALMLSVVVPARYSQLYLALSSMLQHPGLLTPLTLTSLSICVTNDCRSFLKRIRHMRWSCVKKRKRENLHSYLRSVIERQCRDKRLQQLKDGGGTFLLSWGLFHIHWIHAQCDHSS